MSRNGKGFRILFSYCKENSSKFRREHRTVLVLCLLRNLLEQSLGHDKDIKASHLLGKSKAGITGFSSMMH